MVWHSDRYGRKSCGHQIGDTLLLKKNDCQWPRPRSFDQPLRIGRDARHQSADLLAVGDMNNERIKIRSLFDLEDSGHGKGIESIGPQTVHGLGGEGDDSSLADDFSGLANEVMNGKPDK